MTNDKCQKSKSQKSKVENSQKSKVKRQKTKGKRQKAKGKRQKARQGGKDKRRKTNHKTEHSHGRLPWALSPCMCVIFHVYPATCDPDGSWQLRFFFVLGARVMFWYDEIHPSCTIHGQTALHAPISRHGHRRRPPPSPVSASQHCDAPMSGHGHRRRPSPCSTIPTQLGTDSAGNAMYSGNSHEPEGPAPDIQLCKVEARCRLPPVQKAAAFAVGLYSRPRADRRRRAGDSPAPRRPAYPNQLPFQHSPAHPIPSPYILTPPPQQEAATAAAGVGSVAVGANAAVWARELPSYVPPPPVEQQSDMLRHGTPPWPQTTGWWPPRAIPSF